MLGGVHEIEKQAVKVAAVAAHGTFLLVRWAPDPISGFIPQWRI